MRNLAETLAVWASGFNIRSAPTEVQDAAERCLIDVTGVMLAGASLRTLTDLHGFIMEEYGPGPCTLFGHSETISAGGAALLNGAAAHALDFDDTSYDGMVHGSAVVWPAVLAASQRENASGTEALSAYVAGVEVEYALGRILGDDLYFKGWWNTAVLGAIGAAAGAARALRLDPVGTLNAIVIASCQPAGLRAIFGTAAKPYICGRAAQMGLEAALAARAGLAGPSTIDAKAGFLDVLNVNINDNAEIDTLGISFSLISPGVSFKLYPVCSAAQAAIEACKEILYENDLKRDAIREVVCEVTPLVAMCLSYSRPTTVNQAQFSLQFTVGCVIAHGDLTLDHLSEDVIRADCMQKSMAKIKMISSDDLLTDDLTKRNFPEAARVTVTTQDGRRFQKFKGAASGMPINPVSNEKLDQKFLTCASKVLSPEVTQEFLSNLRRLSYISNVRELKPISILSERKRRDASPCLANA